MSERIQDLFVLFNHVSTLQRGGFGVKVLVMIVAARFLAKPAFKPIGPTNRTQNDSLNSVLKQQS